MRRVVITMPAFQAEGTLEQTITDIPAGAADELILVDDASSDNTAELARGLGITVHVHPTNRGYGGNQKTCYTTAVANGADVVVLLHPDYQYDPKAVPLLIAPITGGYADMTFGSRFAGLGDPRSGGMPIYRFIGNRITTFLQNAILGTRFTEMHSGLRAYTRECLLTLPFLSYTDDFAFDSQFLVDALSSGIRVVEVPIRTRYTKESSSISILRSLRYITQSVVYALRMTRFRGRRRRRLREDGSARTTRPHSSLAEKDRLSYAAGLCGGYLAAARTMVAYASETFEAPGWDVNHAGEEDLSDGSEIGALLIDLDETDDLLRLLSRLAPHLSDRSLVAMSASRPESEVELPDGWRVILRQIGRTSTIIARPAMPSAI